MRFVFVCLTVCFDEGFGFVVLRQGLTMHL